MITNLADIINELCIARFAELFGPENTSKLIISKTQGFEPVTVPGDSVIKGMENIGFD